MKIIQKIEEKDLIAYNQYLLTINTKFQASKLLLGIFAIVVALFNFIYDFIIYRTIQIPTLIFNSILIIVGILILLVLEPILKKIVKRRVIKSNQKIDDILVLFTSDSFKWEYADPSKNKRDVAPYKWDQIQKIVETKDYIYIHINKYIILYIKKENCSNILEVTMFLQEKVNNRYIQKIK